jgi:hypothetical protein
MNACGMENTKFMRRNVEGREIGRSRCRWNDNIKMDLEDIWCEYMAGSYKLAHNIVQLG